MYLRKHYFDKKNAEKQEGNELDMDKYMILDQVGSGEEEESDSETSGKDEKEKEDKEGEENAGEEGEKDATEQKPKKKKKKKAINLGSEYCKKIEIYFCDLCKSFLPRLEDQEQALAVHCRGSSHLRRYVKKKDDMALRIRAERIHRLREEQRKALKKAIFNKLYNTVFMDTRNLSSAFGLVIVTTPVSGRIRPRSTRARHGAHGFGTPNWAQDWFARALGTKICGLQIFSSFLKAYSTADPDMTSISFEEEKEDETMVVDPPEDESKTEEGEKKSPGKTGEGAVREPGMDDKTWTEVSKELGVLLMEVEEPGNKSSDDEEDSRAAGRRYDRFKHSEKGKTETVGENEMITKSVEEKSAKAEVVNGGKDSA
ncbi:hypothetical protein J6590_030065 [Homalodisca vitripennis]|nr:hypothetical protein J6590_030065 [Homalodisca vitripennis]